MIYSVWHQGLKKYEYYRTPELQNTVNTPAPAHIRGTKFGATVEQAAWPLPPSAVKFGSGEMARGRIASHRATALGAFTMDTSTIGLIGLGIATFVLWKSGFFKKI